MCHQSRCDTEKCNPQKLFVVWHSWACCIISQSLFIDTLINSFSPVILSPEALAIQQAAEPKKMCVVFSQSSGETMLLNLHKTCILGSRHIADMHWEPAFLLVLEFPLLTGLQQSALQLSLVHLLSCSCFSVPVCWSSGFLLFLCQAESKAFCQQHHKHWRKPSGSCGGSGISRGVKLGTVLIFFCVVFYFFKIFPISYMLSVPFPHPLLFFKSMLYNTSVILARVLWA